MGLAEYRANTGTSDGKDLALPYNGMHKAPTQLQGSGLN